MAGTNRVRYVGVHANGVDVLLPDGVSKQHVAHGQIFNTTKEHAEALLAQTVNWEPVREHAKKTKGGES